MSDTPPDEPEANPTPDAPAASKPSEAGVRAWRMLLLAQRAALASVETSLKAQKLPPLLWYDALLELRRARRALRPSELEKRMLLAQYNVSRLCDRLEANGCIVRRADPHDGRGSLIEITDAGLALLDAMWPIYAAAIDRAVGARLTEEEAETLADLLAKLRGSEPTSP